MADPEKVTVDKTYWEALLRRADFHTTTKLLGQPDPASVTISKTEYDSLLRTGREFDRLKNALFQGGITAETLELLIASADGTGQRKDSGMIPNAWSDDFPDQLPPYQRRTSQPNIAMPYREMSWRQEGRVPSFNLAPGSGPFPNGGSQGQQPQPWLRVPRLERQVSYGAPPSSVPDDAGFDDDDEGFVDSGAANATANLLSLSQPHERRTLYFSGFSERTTYKDLLSTVKGGKLLSVHLRPERSATVTFMNCAAEFLAWAKRHDIYLHSKRIEVKWADRQYTLNNHIANKLANGVTRNILVHEASAHGLTASQIREDMEHIHNLVIIDITFRTGDAFVSTNSVHNALFARTCMLSRTTYKGCKIEFYRDECDVPLPAPMVREPAPAPVPPKRKAAPPINRFNLLNMDGDDNSSDEENHVPTGRLSDDETIDMVGAGVSLSFLDSEST